MVLAVATWLAGHEGYLSLAWKALLAKLHLPWIDRVRPSLQLRSSNMRAWQACQVYLTPAGVIGAGQIYHAPQGNFYFSVVPTVWTDMER